MRRFLLPAVLALFVLLLAAPAHADIVTEEVEYTVDQQVYKGVVMYDDAISTPRGGVLVVHEWWGLNDYARNRAMMLAKEGYVAMAIDMFGDGKTTDHPKEAGAFAGAVFSDLPRASKSFSAAFELLKQHAMTTDRIAAIGYCFGGGIVLNMSRLGLPLAAVASFHGSPGNATGDDSNVLTTPVLLCNGADDTFVPKEALDAIKAEATSAGIEFVFHNYPDAQHGFTNPAATETGKKFGLRVSYNEKADTSSWKTLLWFLNKHLSE